MTDQRHTEALDRIMGLAGASGSEAVTEAQEAHRQALEALAVAPQASVRERLMQAITSDNPMLTYRARVGAFLHVSEGEAEAVLADAMRPVDEWAFNPVDGVYVAPVTCGPEKPAHAFLLRINAESEVPLHGHSADEWGLILKGQLADDLGDLKSPGDLVYRSTEDEHRVWNPGETAAISLNLLFGPQRWL